MIGHWPLTVDENSNVTAGREVRGHERVVGAPDQEVCRPVPRHVL